MAETILPSTSSRLGVKIENETTGEIAFIQMNAINTEISLQATLHTHKLDNGRTVIDGRTKHPFTINITGFCVNYHELEIANNILRDRSHYFRVTVNGETWDSSLAGELVIDQSAESISVSPIQLSFTQAITRQFGYVETEAAADSPNRKLGDVIPKDITISVQQFWETLFKRM